VIGLCNLILFVLAVGFFFVSSNNRQNLQDTIAGTTFFLREDLIQKFKAAQQVSENIE
jgi:hypothetical protein